MFKRAFDFFIFTSLFIACCAVLMTYQTSLLFQIKLPVALYGFVFSGSVCSYNFHWYLTPPHIHQEAGHKLRWNISNRPIHAVLFIIGLLGAAVTSFLLINHWIWLGVTALLTFLYSAPKINHPLAFKLRRIAIGKTIFLAFAWAHVTTLLPLLITNRILSAEHIWFVINRFFFIYCICIVFDRRDVASDKAAGIKSLITYFSSRGVDRLFWTSFGITSITFVILHQWMPVNYLVMLAIPLLIMGLLYERSKSNFSDYLYYFLLDGLMALSAPILILAKFAR